MTQAGFSFDDDRDLSLRGDRAGGADGGGVVTTVALVVAAACYAVALIRASSGQYESAAFGVFLGTILFGIFIGALLEGDE